MKEYSLLAVVSVMASLGLDRLLGTGLVKRREFRMFWGVMTILTTVVNGYLTWRPVVVYGEQCILGIRLFTIPVEDYAFGFGLITAVLALWEFFTRDGNRQNEE